MLEWFRRIRKVSQKLSLPSRESGSGRSQIQLNHSKLTPSADVYLSQLSQVQLAIAHLMQDDSIRAPKAEIRERQLAISRSYKSRSSETEDMIVRTGENVMDLQSEIRDRLDLLIQRTEGEGWHEDLMRIHIVFGILEDSLRRVAKGLSPAKRIRVEAMLIDSSLEKFCELELKSAIATNPEISGRLAMFGRMVVADALLEVRDSIDLSKVMPQDASVDSSALAREQFKILEPFTSELISEHTVRMDRLGLTA